MDIGLIAVIVGLVQVVKDIAHEAIPEDKKEKGKRIIDKTCPLLSIGFGIAAGFIYVAPGQPEIAILAGIVMGLSASGLYSGTKSIAGK